jgi:hypothetical protein
VLLNDLRENIQKRKWGKIELGLIKISSYSKFCEGSL